MNRQGVRDTIKLINGPNARITHNGPWVQTSCPFAPWTHANGTDRTPSFGIIGREDEVSVFHCFTCKRRGTIPMLWEQLGELRGEDYSDRISDAETSEILGPNLGSWEHTGKGKNRAADELGEPINDEILLVYERASERYASERYLRERGLTRRLADALPVLFDPDDGHGVGRALFPVFDLSGRLYGLTGRAIQNGVEPRVRDYYGLPKRSLLLGAHRIGPMRRHGSRAPIALVEGLFDYAKVTQAGFDCVAAMHSGLTEAQAEILKLTGRPVIIMFDDDQAGQEGKAQIAEAHGGDIAFLHTRYTPYAETQDDGYTHLDPGSMNSLQIMHMIGDSRVL